MGEIHLLQTNYLEARGDFEETLRIFKEFNNKGHACQVLRGLGESYRGMNEYKKAEACYRESLAMQYEVGMSSGYLTWSNLALGYAVLHRRDDQQAVSCFKEAIELSKEINSKARLAHCLAGFASVAALRGNAKDAAFLFGAADSQFQSLLAEGIKLESLVDPVD